MKSVETLNLPAGWRSRVFANRVQGLINRGGRIRFFRSYLEFEPNIIERLFGACKVRLKYCDIEYVFIVGSDLSRSGLFSGGIRRRLKLQMTGQNDEIFVVNKVDEIASQIREARDLAS